MISAAVVQLSDSIKTTLQPGDIIMRKGAGTLSYELMKVSGEEYSHCGIIVRFDNELRVIQSIGKSDDNPVDGVQISSLDKFVKYTADSTLFICRQIVDTSKNDAIAERAFYYLNLHIPFDNRFDLTSAKEFYCSELLIHVFMDVLGDKLMDVRKQHKTYVPLFSSFFDERRFKAVFNLKKI
ncbi:MAG: hypothetical protein IPM74_18210 [Crocinitomicaceae bacterium]|nr:hypothetical protein [Crocinitomicaceae bacterium]